MAKISIKERIERELATLAATVEGVLFVNRWDGRKRDQRNLNLTVVASDESITGGAVGGDNGETTEYSFGVALLLLVAQSEDDTTASSKLHNQYLAAMQDIFFNDSRLVETNGKGEPLTINIKSTGTDNPPVETSPGEFYTMLTVDIDYETYKNNPYAGPSITELTE